jgi:hypothetical protein
MSPCWKTWKTSVQNWQVSVKSRAGGGGREHISPAFTNTASWVFQRSCAGCQVSLPHVMAEGDALALDVATRSKPPLQGPEEWAPCSPGPVSWSQVQRRYGHNQEVTRRSVTPFLENRLKYMLRKVDCQYQPHTCLLPRWNTLYSEQVPGCHWNVTILRTGIPSVLRSLGRCETQCSVNNC